MIRDGGWIMGQLGMQRAAKQVSSGWHWCWGFCCHPGTDQLDLGESQEASDKWKEEEQQENFFPPIPGSVFLLPVQLPLKAKRYSYKWGGWGTKHPKTQSLAPPHSSFQNFSCHLTHRQKQEGTPLIAGPPPLAPRLRLWSSPQLLPTPTSSPPSWPY